LDTSEYAWNINGGAIMNITLATLRQATAQEVFDHVVRRMRAQGFKRSVAGGVCAYRDRDGRSDPGGHCMTDAEYFALNGDRECVDWDSIEGKPWRSLVASGLVPPYHALLISCLQLAHDNGLTQESMQRLFKNVAELHELDASVLTEAGVAANSHLEPA
jgi:hypothetical protein